MPFLRALPRFLAPLLAVGVCLGAALLALGWVAPAVGGRTYGQTLGAIASAVWERALLPGRNYRFWVDSLLAATPILLTGLAVAVAFRAAVLNIGGQGQYLAGLLAAAAVGIFWDAPPGAALPALLLASMAAGAALAAVASLLERGRGVPVVLSTLLLNFIAVEAMRALLQGPMREAGGQPQSEQLREAARLPTVPAFHFDLRPWPRSPHVLPIDWPATKLHWGVALALAAAAVVSLVLRRTTFGFRLRAVGENPTAARFAGMNVGRVATATLCLSGALAGLAGGVQVSGVLPYQVFSSSANAGFGFTGIAVALLGRLSPGGVVLSALFFGWLDTAFSALEREVGIPYVAAQATQGAILIAMLIVTAPGWRGRLRFLRAGMKRP